MTEQDFSAVALRNNVANQYSQSLLTGGGSGASTGAGLPEIFSEELPMPYGLDPKKLQQKISPLLDVLKIYQQLFEVFSKYVNQSLSPSAVFGNITPPGAGSVVDLKKQSLISSRG